MCVCVRGDAVSSHQHTSLDTMGQGDADPAVTQRSEGPPGLRTGHVPSERPRSWMTRNILQCFLVSCFFFGVVQRWREVLCTDIGTLGYFDNFH